MKKTLCVETNLDSKPEDAGKNLGQPQLDEVLAQTGQSIRGREWMASIVNVYSEDGTVQLRRTITVDYLPDE